MDLSLGCTSYIGFMDESKPCISPQANNHRQYACSLFPFSLLMLSSAVRLLRLQDNNSPTRNPTFTLHQNVRVKIQSHIRTLQLRAAYSFGITE